MTNSRYETISSAIKDHPIIFGIICTTIGIFITREILLAFGEGIHSELITYPLFAGAIFSWFFAVLATGIVLLFACINRGKKDQYKNVLKKSKKLLTGISIAVIFYIAINLASEALTGTGVPRFSEPHQISIFTNVTSQDIFLISLVFTIIILLFIVAPLYNKNRKRIFTFVIIIVLIALLLSPSIFFCYNKKEIPETYSFSWSSVPGDDEEKFKKCLKDDFDIDWVENAEICNDGMTIRITQDERSAEIIMGEMKEKAILKISDGRTHELKVKEENGKLNIYYPETTQKGKSEQILPFFAFLVVSFLIACLLWCIMPKKAAKDDNLRDLLFYFSIIPALIVASLVLIEHDLVTYPNYTGHAVVGFLFISGFATLVILILISLKNVKNGMWIWGFTVAASLAAISGFSCGFLLLEDLIHEIGTFRKILLFSIAIILVILQYSFAYEKLMKYRFTEWWRRTWRPIAMIIGILVILIVSVLNPKEVGLKLSVIFLVLLFVWALPWILGFIRFRNLKLPQYQGMVLVKADPGSLKKVVNELDGRKGVYQTMVVRGEYDVCLTVEGVSSGDIEKKILKIRKIDGIASTTTLTDISEFFEGER